MPIRLGRALLALALGVLVALAFVFRPAPAASQSSCIPPELVDYALRSLPFDKIELSPSARQAFTEAVNAVVPGGPRPVPDRLILLAPGAEPMFLVVAGGQACLIAPYEPTLRAIIRRFLMTV